MAGPGRTLITHALNCFTMTITIDSAATLLNYHTSVFAEDLKVKTRQGLEFENGIAEFCEGEEYYAAELITATGEVLQPYQGAFTKKGSITDSEVAYKIRPIKIDLEWTEIQLLKWHSAWRVNWFEAGRDPLEWSYPRYIYDRVLMPKMLEELNTLAWSGEYAAPTAGTAGASINSVDGYAKVLADLITAGTVPAGNVIGITAPTTTNIREMVEQFLSGIPTALTRNGGQVLMSTTNRRNFVYDYRGEFMHTNTLTQPETGQRSVYVDDFNVTLTPVAAMGSSNRLIFLPNDHNNMKVATRRGFPAYPELQFFRSPRTLQVTGTFYRAFLFENPLDLYVGDEA